MMTIDVQRSGELVVTSLRLDGSVHQVTRYSGWPDLLRPWCSNWSIDNRRQVFVRWLVQP